MNIKDISTALGVAPNTIRNWLSVYQAFLSPGAHPPPGKRRVLSTHDLQVLALISTLKDTNQDQDTILERLRAMQGDGWQGLPDLPVEWGSTRATMPVDLAASRASELAQIAVLQTELQHTRAALTSALAERDSLRAELAVLQAAEVGHTEQLHALELQLREAEGRIASLQARLGQYSLNDRPIPLVLLIAFTALAVLVAVLLIFAFSRLLL